MTWEYTLKKNRQGPAQNSSKNQIRETAYHIEYMLKGLVLDIKNARTLDEANEIVAVYEGHTQKTIRNLQEYAEYSLRESDITRDKKEAMSQQFGANQWAKEELRRQKDMKKGTITYDNERKTGDL
jgi:hypothetical protein